MNGTPERIWRILAKCAAIAVILPALYILSYLALGTHISGENWVPRYTYHDRIFPFDPWVYVPLAKLECKLRRPDVEVVLDGSPGRDGSILYAFWSGQPKSR